MPFKHATNSKLSSGKVLNSTATTMLYKPLFLPALHSAAILFAFKRQCPHSWRISQVSLQIKYSAIGCATLFSFPSACQGVRGFWPQLEDEWCCTTLLCHGVQEGSKWHWVALSLSQMGSLQPFVTLPSKNLAWIFEVVWQKYSQEI